MYYSIKTKEKERVFYPSLASQVTASHLTPDFSPATLSPKATPNPKSALGPIKTEETASNNKDVASNNYNSNIIVINISRNKNKGGKTQELVKYTRAT